jgi:hypothetical protein
MWVANGKTACVDINSIRDTFGQYSKHIICSYNKIILLEYLHNVGSQRESRLC